MLQGHAPTHIVGLSKYGYKRPGMGEMRHTKGYIQNFHPNSGKEDINSDT
jgi:hypothetical protein